MNVQAAISIHQRSRGSARVDLTGRDGLTRLADLRQQGSAKAFVLPGPDNAPEIVFLNTSGGLTGGDRLDYAVNLGPGCRAVATTQTAERVYRSNDGTARLQVDLELGAGAHLDWLPQETILYDQGCARRRTTVTLSPGSSVLMAETLILGRAAMGEVLRQIAFHDWREVRQGDRPLHLEALALDAVRLADGPAGLAGARALATVVLVAPQAGDALGPARAVLNEPGVRAGVSALPGRLVARLMAADGWPLRRQLARLLDVLRRAPLPRVWQM